LRKKIILIDNYVKLNKLLLECLKALSLSPFSSPDFFKYAQLKSVILQLIKDYEKLIRLTKLNDESFAILKKELNYCIANYSKLSSFKNPTPNKIEIKIIALKRDFLRLTKRFC
jgi:hypothetical protein